MQIAVLSETFNLSDADVVGALKLSSAIALDETCTVFSKHSQQAQPQSPPLVPMAVVRPARHFTKTSATLFVGNIDAKATESLLGELFTQAGPVEDVLIPRDPSGAPKGFAFVEFADEIAVRFACDMLDGVSLFGRQLRVKAALADAP
jgi:RNA recognition motif-containing protein